MRDAVPPRQHLMELLSPPFRVKAFQLKQDLSEQGLPFAVWETVRHPMRQAYYFTRGREYRHGKGWVVVRPDEIVTKAAPCQSPHEYGQAVDFVLDIPGENPWEFAGYEKEWAELGFQARALGLTWGGDWTVLRDRPHVEQPSWRSMRPKDWKMTQHELLQKAISLWPDVSVSR